MKIWYAIPLLVALHGCGLVERQSVFLEPSEILAITERVGELTDKNAEAWMKEIAAMKASDVLEVKAVGEQIVAELKPPLQEAAEKGGMSLLENIGKNPSWSGILGGVPVAFLAFASVLARRASMKGQK